MHRVRIRLLSRARRCRAAARRWRQAGIRRRAVPLRRGVTIRFLELLQFRHPVIDVVADIGGLHNDAGAPLIVLGRPFLRAEHTGHDRRLPHVQ